MPIAERITATDVLLRRSPRPNWDHLEKAMAATSPVRVLRWGAVLREVAARTAELLDIELSDLVVGAWQKSEELARYADPERTPSDETVVTEIAESTVELDYHPSLTVLVNAARLPDVALDIDLSLTVKGLSLTIRGGEIRRMRTGSMEASGRISVAGATIVARESEPIFLPGEWIAEEEANDAA